VAVGLVLGVPLELSVGEVGEGDGEPDGCTRIATMIVIAVNERATITAIHGQTIGGFGAGAVSVVITVVLAVTGCCG
jgi:hypothetical protein